MKYLMVIISVIVIMSLSNISLANNVVFEDRFISSSGQEPISLLDFSVLGQSFSATNEFNTLVLAAPTWNTTDSQYTFTLRHKGPEGEVFLSVRVLNANDNQETFHFDTLAPGMYYAQMSSVLGQAGWWTVSGSVAGAQAFTNGREVSGFRRMVIRYSDEPSPGVDRPAVDPADPPIPATGDTSTRTAYYILAFCAVMGLVIVRKWTLRA